MYMLSVDSIDKGSSGAFAVDNDYGVKVIYFFEEEDDAVRYVGLLEAEDYPLMEVVEIEDDVAIKVCNLYNYRYVVIKPDDVVIPPKLNVIYSKD